MPYPAFFTFRRIPAVHTSQLLHNTWDSPTMIFRGHVTESWGTILKQIINSYPLDGHWDRVVTKDRNKALKHTTIGEPLLNMIAND